jgi:tetratricopeptide (TPR) repeat protein
MDERIKQLINLGREHYKNREFDKAEKLLSQVLKDNQTFADVYNMLGVIYHDLGQFRRAEECLEQALQINPGYTEAALNLAVTYNELGKYQQAKEIYSRAMAQSKSEPRQLDPFARGKLANMHADLAQAYADSGLAREAIHELEKAVGLCPHFADLQTRLGKLLGEAKELVRAREHYEAAVAARPNYVPARVQLGVTLLSLG